MLVVERLAAGEADILQKLWHRVELMQQFARRLRGRDELGEQLPRRESSVAGRRMVRQEHLSRLFAAHIEPAFLHPFEHMAVAELGPLAPMPLAIQNAFEAEIRHTPRSDAPAHKTSPQAPARHA